MNRNCLRVVDLGRMGYGAALERQEACVADRLAERVPDTLFLVEHDPVYTLGRNANPAHVLPGAGPIERVATSRGGDVTYHGPGQLVGYPILRLAGREQGVVWYVGLLEQVLIRLLAGYGLAATTDACNRGVWLGRDKVAALGVRVTRGITMHGFALNVTTDLAPYRGIIPCGLPDRGVTTLAAHCPGVTIEAVKAPLVRCFAEAFGHAAVVAIGDAAPPRTPIENAGAG